MGEGGVVSGGKYAVAIGDLVKYRDELLMAISQLERLQAIEMRVVRGRSRRGRLPGRRPPLRQRKAVASAGN